MTPKRRVSRRVSDISKSAIHEMTRLSKEVEDVAFLSWAKPTSGTPDHICEAAVSAIKNGLVGGYTETSGLAALREEIVKKLKRDNAIDAAASQVLVTVGAIEGLAAAVMAVVDPGDEVILPTPTYSTHIRQVVIASGKPVLVPTIEEEGFVLDIARHPPGDHASNQGHPVLLAEQPDRHRIQRTAASRAGGRCPRTRPDGHYGRSLRVFHL